jgi:ABC-type polysaccharide/polyol phosphate transport system ATPase subunit
MIMPDTSDEYAIRIKDLKKDFYISHSGVASLKSRMMKMNKLPPLERLEVLRGISFDVKRGECVAVVGRNGAGKSTLLSLMSRIYKPTDGSIEINGRVAPLLELGAGFHLDLTGYENIFVNGMILGISHEELEERIDEIVEFSELYKHIDSPVRTYSTGMTARLGFSIAVHVDADVLLVDEILAVGDQEFRAKCALKMDAMRKKGTTILMVSHSGQDVVQMADRAIWIQRGLIEAEGDPKLVLHEYLSKSDNELAPNSERLIKVAPLEKPKSATELAAEIKRGQPVMAGTTWTESGMGVFSLSSGGSSDAYNNRSVLRIGAANFPDVKGAPIASYCATTWGTGFDVQTGSLIFMNAEWGPQSQGKNGTDAIIGLCKIGSSKPINRLYVRNSGDIHLNGSGFVIDPSSNVGFTGLPQMQGKPERDPLFAMVGNTPCVDDASNNLLWHHNGSWTPVQADAVETSEKSSGKVELARPYCLFTHGKPGSISLAIPAASDWPGAWIKVKWTLRAEGKAITITCKEGRVEGESKFALKSDANSYPDLMLQSDGTDWWKVSG